MSFSALIYLVVFGCGVLATLAVSPLFGIMLYEMQYLVNPPGRWWYHDLPDLRYSFLIMVLVAGSYLPRSKEYRANRLFALPQWKWLAALTLLMVVSSVWAIDQDLHYKFLTRYLKVLLFVVLAYKVIDLPWKLESVLGIYLFGTSYLCFIIWQTGRTGSGRLEGIGSADSSDANGTASLVATTIPLMVFYILYAKRRWQQVASLAALAFTLNALVLLNSRGGFLACAVSCAYFSLFVWREKGKSAPKLKLAIGIVGAIALFVYLADDVFWSRMSTLKEVAAVEEVESHSRVEYWKKTPEMLAEHPLGGGAQTYVTLSPNYLPKEWLTGGVRAVHSTWFEVMGDYGYHGLLIFLGYVVATFMLMRRVKGRLRGSGDHYHLLQGVALESAWLSLLVSITFISSFYMETTYWLPMFIAAFANIHLKSQPPTAAATSLQREEA
jgi:hypothetical protein